MPDEAQVVAPATQMSRIEADVLMALQMLTMQAQTAQANQAALLARCDTIDAALAQLALIVNGSPPTETANWNPQSAIIGTMAAALAEIATRQTPKQE